MLKDEELKAINKIADDIKKNPRSKEEIEKTFKAMGLLNEDGSVAEYYKDLFNEDLDPDIE